MRVSLQGTSALSILAFTARSSISSRYVNCSRLSAAIRPFVVLMLVLLSGIGAEAQQQTISGTVTSTDNGEPLPGVNVVVKGTSTGTTTNSEGLYSLEVGSDAVLSFSFIGFASQEISIGGRSVVNVVMAPEVAQLTEVVVTAAGIERERRAMGTRMESVKGDRVQQISEADPLRGLQGKVAGVNITSSSGIAGSATRITMRGNRSLLGNNQPLIIVDGIPYDNSQTNTTNQLVGGGSYGSGFASVDPNNIESLTLLPPGSAEASIYGVRAANGVLVITTKTGKSHASRKGMEVSVSSGFSFEEISGLPDYQNRYGTGTGFAYGQVNGSWGAAFNGAVDYPSITTIPLWLDYAAAFPDRPATVPYQAYPDNVKDFFRVGKLFENSVTLSGGNDVSNFTTTISRTDQDGYVPASGFERTNISIGANTILSNMLVIGGTLSFSNRVQKGPPGGASNAIGNGSAFARILYLGRNWNLHGEPFEDPLTRESLFFIDRTQATNPWWATKYDGFETHENRVTGNINFTYDFTEELSLSYRIGLTNYNEMNQEWFRPGGRAAGGIGQVTDDYVSSMEIESFLRLNYSKPLSDDITLNAFVAHNINQRTRDNQSYVGTQLIDFNIIDMDNTTSVLNNGGIYMRRRIMGLLGEVQFQFKDYLFVTANGRNDWSSTLPAENRSFFYPALSTSFIFTEALGLQNSFLSFGKLRAGWSKVGNDADPYLLNSVFNINPQFVTQSVLFPFGGVPGTTLGDVATDPNLTPEFTRTVELGTDLQFYNNRAGLSVTVYESVTTNGIAPQSYPATSGFTSFLTNFGTVENRGIEISLNLTPLILPNGLRWDINGNFTHNRNVVTALAPGVQEIVVRNLFGGGITPVLRPGLEYGVMRGSVSVRDDEGNLLIDPSNGQMIRSLQPEIIGNPNPDFIAGLTNSFSFKGITLSALFDWRQGGDQYSTTLLSQLGRGVTRDTEDREINKVIPGVLGDVNTSQPLYDAEGNKVPNNIQVEINDIWFGETFAINSADEWNVFDGTVVRLREVALGYTLPRPVLAKTPFGSASITFTGRNLWYHAPNVPKHSNFDPEMSTFGTSNAQGFDYDNPPSTRRYGVNLRFTF